MRLVGLWVAVFLGACGGQTPAPEPPFEELRCTLAVANPRHLEPGRDPHMVQAADLNEDGLVDLVSSNNRDDTVSIFLRIPGGGFAPRVDYATGNEPTELALGDLDRDTHLDIVVANYEADTISVLRGNGDGTFASQVVYATGDTPYTPVIGDLTGDGWPDIVVADRATSLPGDGTLSLLVNEGAGVFAPRSTITTDPVPSALGLGDFDMNGSLDIVDVGVWTHRVSIHLNNGDGTFQPRRSFDGADIPLSLVINDFDRDGKLDVATASYGSPYVAILRGRGDGTMEPHVRFTTPSVNQDVVAGDVDADGDDDLVVADNWTASVSVLPNQGDGTFGAAMTFASGGKDEQRLVLAHLDDDAHLDLAIAQSKRLLTDVHKVTILSGRGDGSFESDLSYTVGTAPTHATVADVDANGTADLVIGSDGGGVPSEDLIHILSGAGDGTFDVTSLHVGPWPNAVGVGDVDGDGHADLVVGSRLGTDIRVFRGDGSGGYSVGAWFAADPPEHLVVTDFDADGDADLVVGTSAGIAVFRGDGAGQFVPAQTLTVGATSYLLVVDVDANGALDVVSLSGGALVVTRAFLPGLFGTPTVYPANGVLVGLAAGDALGDDQLDLAVVARDTMSVHLFRNTGGTFVAAGTLATGVSPSAVAIVDLTGDGVSDIAVTDDDYYTPAHAALAIYKNTRNDTFEAPVHFTANVQPTGLVAADLDGDARADLAVIDSGSSANSTMATLMTILQQCSPLAE